MNNYSVKTEQLLEAASVELELAQSRFNYTEHVRYAMKCLKAVWKRIMDFEQVQHTCPVCHGYTENSRPCEQCEQADVKFDLEFKDEASQVLSEFHDPDGWDAPEEEEEEEAHDYNNVPSHVCEEHMGTCPFCGDRTCMWCLIETIQEEVKL